MAEFATLDGLGGDMFSAPTGTDPDALGLTNPDSVLSGTSRGQQALGSPNIKTDSASQRIIVNDNTNNRVAFGRIGTGKNDWGLKVSKAGINVDRATSDQLVFNSSQNTFKIVQTGTIATGPTSVSTSGASYGSFYSTGGVTTHGLSYIPAIIAYFSNAGLYAQLPYTSMWQNSSNAFAQFTIKASVDATTVGALIEVFAYNTTGLTIPSLDVKYYLLQETAN